MNKFIFEPLDGEEWKPINGFFGYYISNFGRIWSEKQKKRFLNTSKDGCGYIKVRLYINNKPYSKLVHRLVAEAFIPNPNNYPQINHKDENKNNNRADNLEWCTQQYNIRYGTGIKRRAESQKGVPKTEEQKQKIREKRKLQNMSFLCKPIWMCDVNTHEKIKRFDGVSKAALEVFGDIEKRHNIKNVLHGRKRSALGYWWCFENA